MKTAVILAARKERDCEIPYPLMPIPDDGCLLDRTLCLLREVGFEKIFIVVGFAKELFTKYQNDSKVELIFNDDFEFSGSMASLACCGEKIDSDFVLIDGDTFFEKQLLIRLEQETEGNVICMTEESGSGDECYVETKNGFVTKITKDRRRVRRFEGEMIGCTRISYHTYQNLLAEWRDSDNSILGYEYLLMDVTEPLDRKCLTFPNVIWGDVDNQTDYLKLKETTIRRLKRKEDPFDEDNLKDYLSLIFPEEELGNAEITQIGGMSNKNFKACVNGRNYVLRVPGPGSEGMVERESEKQNSMMCNSLGITPAIRYFNAQTGIKIADFIEDAETQNPATMQRHDHMKQIAHIYKVLHNSQIRLRNEFCLFNEIEKYEKLMAESCGEMYEGYYDVRPDIFALEEKLNQLGVELRPCHNDPIADNFIKDKNGIIHIIDWEYSGMNDPIAEIASMFLESEFTEENQNYFLNKYFEGEIPENVRLKIICYQILWDILWSIWTVIKEKSGNDYGTYGQDRFNRALRNLKILKSKY